VTSDLVSGIILHDSFKVRLLSIREVQNLNERKLQQALLYAIRLSRPANTPKLQGLYIFGHRDAAPPSRFPRHIKNCPRGIAPIDTLPSYGGVMYSEGAQIGAQWNQKSGDALAEAMKGVDKWYQNSGKVIPKPPSLEWANTMQACEGIISFDAVLCHGPRHSPLAPEADPDSKVPWYKQQSAHISPRVASYAIAGCSGCGTAPEGFSRFGLSPKEQFPLLAPLPLHSSTVKSAKTPFSNPPTDSKLLVRCLECLRNRYCESCFKWWCEDCYEIPNQSANADSLQPWEAVGTTIGIGGYPGKNVKVHIGLCVQGCLVAEMMSGTDSMRMWG